MNRCLFSFNANFAPFFSCGGKFRSTFWIEKNRKLCVSLKLQGIFPEVISFQRHPCTPDADMLPSMTRARCPCLVRPRGAAITGVGSPCKTCRGGVAPGAAGVSSLSGRDCACCSERVQRSHDQDSSVKGRTVGNERLQRK